jgi:hypothetical protein
LIGKKRKHSNFQQHNSITLQEFGILLYCDELFGNFRQKTLASTQDTQLS